MKKISQKSTFGVTNLDVGHFFTRIARFALHKYLANWCVPFTRFLLKLVLERSFLGHFVIYHRVTMIDVSCVTFFPKAFFWQPRRPIMARRAGSLADVAIGLSGMYWCRVWVKKNYIRVIVQHNTPIVLYSNGTRYFRVFRWIEIKGLCMMKCPSEKLQNLPYFT